MHRNLKWCARQNRTCAHGFGEPTLRSFHSSLKKLQELQVLILQGLYAFPPANIVTPKATLFTILHYFSTFFNVYIKTSSG